MSGVGPSVTQVTAAAAAGRTTAVEQVRRCAAAHARTARLGAFTQVDVGSALAEAERADRRGAAGSLPLRGVVLAVKDNIDTAGFATTAGTPALRTHRPRRDAEVVRTLRRAGAVVLGKANMHELAYGVTGDNPAFGRVRHPLRPERIPGGSSSGSAAAVAAGVVTAALGTETGCSVRVPAALCGVVGFRPTVDACSGQGMVPVSWTRDTVGVLARDVADIRAVDAVLRPQSGRAPDEDGDPLRGLRLAAPHRPFRQGLAPPLRAVFETRLAALEGAGVEIVEADPPGGVQDAAARCGLTIARYETPHGIDRYLAAHGGTARFTDVAAQVASPDVARLLRPPGEERVAEEDYRAALADRAHLGRLLDDFVAHHHVDGLLVPTAPVTAPTLLGGDRVEVGGRPAAAFPLLVRNADISSVLGLPALTLPAAADESGLPFGIDLQFPAGADSRLLAVAHACERLWRCAGAPGPRRGHRSSEHHA
ncbi:amidase family protein [Streptomyces qinglanensis]|uniref:amidase family protein n=1 Tax=Streptomyces qinglanensis TaxID=943816 RepID=UPI003794C4BE